MRPGPARSAPLLRANHGSPWRGRAGALAGGIIPPRGDVWSGGEYNGDGAPCRGAAVRRNTLALLALLAAADKNGASRDKLIAFLWPESDTEHGRNLLRQACFALRRDLHQPELILGATELRLNPQAGSTAVHAFADALERGDLAGAVALYGGPFLDGFYLRGSDAVEPWAGTARGRRAPP